MSKYGKRNPLEFCQRVIQDAGCRGRADQLHFFDLEDPGFFSATVHQTEGSDGFEVNIQLADLGNGPVANFSYMAPTLYAAGQIVTPH